MGNSLSRVVGCFGPRTQDQERITFAFSEPLDEGLGHSFCYVRPVLDSPHLSPFHSDRYVAISLPLDSEIPHWSLQLNHENAGDTHKLKNLPETSFKYISGASVSANTSTPRTVVSHEQFNSFANGSYDRAAAFESTPSFSSIPLQPVPRGLSQSGPITASLSGQVSGPLDRGFQSGPLERGFMSGPLERGFLSGPLERSCMSGPMEATDRSLFSAPLAGPYATYLRRRRKSLAQLVRTFGNPVKRVLLRSLSQTTYIFARTQRSGPGPGKLPWGHAKDTAKDGMARCDCPVDCGYISSDLDSRDSHNLQWAQGKAGEDRMHVVLSEEHGWLFVGIYDGFNGPDAPDFLMSNLYREVYRELRGLLWDRKEKSPGKAEQAVENLCEDIQGGLDIDQDHFGSVGSHGEAQHFGAGSQRQGDCSDCKEEVRCKLNEEYVKPDSGYWNAELGACPDLVRVVNVGGALSGDPGCEVPLHGASAVAERIRFSCTGVVKTAHQLQMHEELSDLNISDRNLTVGDAEAARLNLYCEGNYVIERGSPEGHDEKQSIKEPGPEKQRKFWSGRSLLKFKMKKAHMKGKQPRSRFLPWSAEGDQDKKGGQKRAENDYKQGGDKLCKVGNADHTGVLKALARALESTERAYLQMADHSMKETPELALMGSCVLVMLMKGEDVYVMNVGDSRAILARVKSDPQVLSSCSREPSQSQVDDSKRIGARDTQLRQELERIMEETPTELETFESPHTSSCAGPLAASPCLSAVQLSSDHSTNIEEEILRIKAEHPDDSQSISNERVKGTLKVTRAFGAGFLKMPRWNNALLERFRVDYVGTAPYVTCLPALQHHMLGPNDRFLVLSSDGLYQYLSNEEVISHVEWFMERFPDGDPAQHLIEELLFRAAKKAGMDFHELLDIPQGDRRKYHDDVSVMVISLEGRIWRSFG